MAELGKVPRLLKVREVAALTSLEEFRVYAAIQAGDLKAMRVGRTYRVSECEVVCWIERGHQALVR